MISLFLIELVLLLAFALEIMQMEQYLLLLLFGVAVIESNENGKLVVSVNKEFFALVMGFTVFYFTMVLTGKIPINAFYALRYWVGPIVAYYIGITLGKSSVSRVVALITVIALGKFLHGCLNVLTSTDLSIANRSVTNFWTGTKTSATLQGTYFTFGIALASSWLCFGKIRERGLAVIMAGLTIWNCMQTASRTALYMLGIILVCTIVLKEYISKDRKRFVKFILKTALLIGIVVGAAVIAYQYNLLGMRTFFRSSFLGQRLAGIEEENAMSRNELWLVAIQNISKYPLGIPELDYYAHNLWLDIGLSSGIFSMLLIAIYSGMSMVTMYKVCKMGLSTNTRILIYTLYLATTIGFMLEPILQAVPYTFCCFVMINGAIASLEYRTERYMA